MNIKNIALTGIIAIVVLTVYAIGFGYGQSSAYNKIMDDETIMDIYMEDDLND